MILLSATKVLFILSGKNLNLSSPFIPLNRMKGESVDDKLKLPRPVRGHDIRMGNILKI